MNTILPVLCSLLSLAVVAQTEDPGPLQKGNFFVSAGGSWKSKEYRVKSDLRWSIDPQVGYFLTDRLSVGVGSTFGFTAFDYSETNSITGVTATNSSNGNWWGIGPTIRGYLGSEKFALFGQLSGNFGQLEKTSENNFTIGNDTYLREQGSFSMYSFSPGAAFYFGPKIGAEVMATAYWVIANVRSGNVTEDGQVEELNSAKYDATGGGWAINLVYFFSLAGGAQ